MWEFVSAPIRKLIQLVLTKSSPTGFAGASSNNSHCGPGKSALSLCRCSRGGSERVRNMPRVTQLAMEGVAQAGLPIRLLSFLMQGRTPDTGKTPSKKLLALKYKK